MWWTQIIRSTNKPDQYYAISQLVPSMNMELFKNGLMENSWNAEQTRNTPSFQVLLIFLLKFYSK